MVVVTPTRTARDRSTLPYRAEQLSRDEIQRVQLSRTLPESLKYVPGIQSQKTAHAQGSPYIRGFTGFRTLFMIDGIRLNNSVFRDGPNQYWGTVDPYSFASLELVKGPASSLYGSDAIGGSVNVLSASPFDGLNEAGYSLRSLFRYSSAEDSLVFRQEGGLALGEKLALRAGLSLKDFGNLESGAGELPNTGYDELDFDMSLEWLQSDRAVWRLVHQSVKQDNAWRVHKTESAVPYAGSSIGSEKQRILDQARQLTYLRLDVDHPLDFVEHAQATVSWHRQEEESFRLRSRERRDLQGFDVDTLGAQLQFDSTCRGHDLVYGVEYYHDEVDSFKHSLNADRSILSRSIQGPVGDASSYDSLGLYLQDQYALSERLSLLGGARFSYFDADVGIFENPDTGTADSFSDNWETYTFNARGIYRLDAAGRSKLYAGIAQGFRAPNLSDLSRLDSARSDEIETAAPGLDPESFLTYEVGARAGNAQGGIELSGYYTQIDDMIVRTPTGRRVDEQREVTKRNSGEGFVAGIELGGNYAISEGLNLRAALTWMDGEVDTYPSSEPARVREPIDRLMPLTAHLAARYDINEKLWLEVGLSLVDDADKLSTRDRSDTQRIPPGGTPGYELFDLRGGYTLNERLNITLAVENLGDENYRVHGSGLNEPGRNIIIGLEARL